MRCGKGRESGENAICRNGGPTQGEPMMKSRRRAMLCMLVTMMAMMLAPTSHAQIGRQFPSERTVVKDAVTGTPLTFLTSKPHRDSKIYPTHPQWTSDGKWVVFRSALAGGEAMAVNEETGQLVQVSEGGYTGMLNLSTKSMKLYFMRGAAPQPVQVIEVDLGRLFLDVAAGKVAPATAYQSVRGVVPAAVEGGGDMALDAGNEWVYFRTGAREAARHLAAGTKLEPAFGPRGMGAGPGGIARMNLLTGETRHVVSVPFQVGHIQANLWNPGEIVFCWETGGKSPQRTWTVMADGSGLRPLYPEAAYEWVTHEAVISKDEVAMALVGHRTGAAKDSDWGIAGTREKPTGLAIVNLRTREMTIAGQTPSGSGLWHVHGSADGRFAVGDDFGRNVWLIDRRTHEMMLLTTGHKTTAADHPHPTFSADGTRIEIQSAMLSADNRTMNICIVPVPESWLKRP
jgi:oligogalacturonide lyase